MAMPPFYIIRHGQTDWNRDSRYQGALDIPLNDTGRGQAAVNGRHLASLDHDWSAWDFVASPLGRATETMRIIRAGIGLEPDGFRTDDRLIEVSFGQWERMLFSDLDKKFPEEREKRESNKWEHVPPGGESYAQAVPRLKGFLDELDTQSVIVCHGGIIRAARYLLEGIDGQEAAQGLIPQDRVYAFDGSEAKWGDAS